MSSALVDQLVSLYKNNKKAQNVVETTISDLLIKKRSIAELEKSFVEILENYTRFYRNRDSVSKDLNLIGSLLILILQ